MKPLVQVEGLRVVARNDAGLEFPIVKGVDFAIKQGEVLALIGESGSGKTTIALSLMGYARSGCRIAGGSVRVGEQQVLDLDDIGLARLRGRTVAYIAQSASSSFNPSRTLMDQVVESAAIHRTMTRAAAEAKAKADAEYAKQQAAIDKAKAAADKKAQAEYERLLKKTSGTTRTSSRAPKSGIEQVLNSKSTQTILSGVIRGLFGTGKR